MSTALIGIVRDAFNDGFCEGMREHTSSKGGNTWFERRSHYEAKAAALIAERDALARKVETMREALDTAIDAIEYVERCSIYSFDGDFTPENERLLPRLRAALEVTRPDARGDVSGHGDAS